MLALRGVGVGVGVISIRGLIMGRTRIVGIVIRIRGVIVISGVLDRSLGSDVVYRWWLGVGWEFWSLVALASTSHE